MSLPARSRSETRREKSRKYEYPTLLGYDGQLRGGQVTNKARQIFTSYSHKDERFKLDLDKHLTPLLLQGRVATWNDRHIRAGTPLYEAIGNNIREADIILMLVSSDYVSSKSCQDEMAVALERSAAKQSLAIPIVIRACDWTGLPIGQLLAANRDGLPINSAPDSDVAWFEVVLAIKQILNDWDIENAQDTDDGASPSSDISDAAADERVISRTSKDKPAEQWVYRKDSNEEEWESLKSTLEQTMISLAERDAECGITIQTRRWAEKTLVDFRLPKHRNPRRLLIADISGFSGYPGYQLEAYPRDNNVKLPFERVRWMINSLGERVLKQLEPKTGEEFSPASYADNLWAAIRALG